MSLPLHHFRLAALLGVTTALAGADVASAGWMGIRNDTKDTVIVQETLVINGQARQGRPQRLFAGEAVRDTQCVGPVRRITVFDPKVPATPIFQGNFPCPAANENILYLLKSDGKGGLTVEAIKSPAVGPLKK
jgi:hypothetical protein